MRALLATADLGDDWNVFFSRLLKKVVSTGEVLSVPFIYSTALEHSESDQGGTAEDAHIR